MDVALQQFAEYPNLHNFLRSFAATTFLRGVLTNILVLQSKYGSAYCQLAEDVLLTMTKMGVDSTAVFENYVYEYLRDLARFEKTGTYDNGSFDEIREKIYDNQTLMNDTYLPGLFLSHAFTSLLHEKYQFWERAFRPLVNSSMRGIEIGFGDGFYLWSILRRVPDINVYGLDISPHALNFADKLLSVSGFSHGRYALRLGNFCKPLALADKTHQWCILTEVIEHVAEPAFSLGEIARIMQPGGLFFMTTVIDSNHMDHITNFDSPKVVDDLLQSSGFDILDTLRYDVSKELKDIRDRAVGLAHVCRRR
jgi:ubiquinone/menaquinone biosynthesis C-methylase UbiE